MVDHYVVYKIYVFLAWKVDENSCSSGKTQIFEQSEQTTKASAFNGFRQYLIHQACDVVGK